MKKTFLLLLFSALAWSQEKPKKDFRVIPEFYFGFALDSFQGDNYLAKDHKSPSIGGQMKINLLHYKNFNLGMVLNRGSINLSDEVLSIARTNINSLGGAISYSYLVNKKWILAPEISYSKSELRQKESSGTYNFGDQDGNKVSFGINVKYKLYRQIGLFAAVHYSHYNLQVNTTPEFQNYFDHTKAITFSVGFTVL